MRAKNIDYRRTSCILAIRPTCPPLGIRSIILSSLAREELLIVVVIRAPRIIVLLSSAADVISQPAPQEEPDGEGCEYEHQAHDSQLKIVLAAL